jgi:hypothetical protein
LDIDIWVLQVSKGHFNSLSPSLRTHTYAHTHTHFYTLSYSTLLPPGPLLALCFSLFIISLSPPHSISISSFLPLFITISHFYALSLSYKMTPHTLHLSPTRSCALNLLLCHLSLSQKVFHLRNSPVSLSLCLYLCLSVCLYVSLSLSLTLPLIHFFHLSLRPCSIYVCLCIILVRLTTHSFFLSFSLSPSFPPFL